MSLISRATRRALFSVLVGALAYLELYILVVRLPTYELLGLSLLPAAAAGAIFYFEGRKASRLTCETILRAMLSALYRENSGRYRANVMCPDWREKRLSIRFAYNMDGFVDRRLTLAPGKGCAGRAFASGNIQTFDFSKMDHAAYSIDVKATPVWADLRSIISYPIREDDGKVVAVLSIDSSEPMRTTGFRDSGTQVTVGLYSEIVYQLLESE